jgi:hypothetical protein
MELRSTITTRFLEMAPPEEAQHFKAIVLRRPPKNSSWIVGSFPGWFGIVAKANPCLDLSANSRCKPVSVG